MKGSDASSLALPVLSCRRLRIIVLGLPHPHPQPREMGPILAKCRFLSAPSEKRDIEVNLLSHGGSFMIVMATGTD